MFAISSFAKFLLKSDFIYIYTTTWHWHHQYFADSIGQVGGKSAFIGRMYHRLFLLI